MFLSFQRDITSYSQSYKTEDLNFTGDKNNIGNPLIHLISKFGDLQYSRNVYKILHGLSNSINHTMKLFSSIALGLSCIVFVVSTASISGGVEKNEKGVIAGKIAVNDKVSGVNVGAGVQGNNQGLIQSEVGAGQK